MKTDNKITFLETLEEEMPALAVTLKEVPPLQRREMMVATFASCCRKEKDKDALAALKWYLLAAQESPIACEDPASASFRAAATYIMLRDDFQVRDIDPGFERLPETRAAAFAALASGLCTAWSPQHANEYLKMIECYSMGSETGVKAATSAIREAVQHAKEPLRISKLLAYKDIPLEIRRVLTIALIRNTESDALVMSTALAAVLDGCLPSAFEVAAEKLQAVKEFDDKVRQLLSKFAEFQKTSPGWFAPEDKLEVAYKTAADGTTEIRLGFRVLERKNYGKSDYNAVYTVYGNMFKLWRRDSTNTNGKIDFKIVSADGRELRHLHPHR